MFNATTKEGEYLSKIPLKELVRLSDAGHIKSFEVEKDRRGVIVKSFGIRDVLFIISEEAYSLLSDAHVPQCSSFNTLDTYDLDTQVVCLSDKEVESIYCYLYEGYWDEGWSSKCHYPVLAIDLIRRVGPLDYYILSRTPLSQDVISDVKREIEEINDMKEKRKVARSLFTEEQLQVLKELWGIHLDLISFT